MRQQISCRTLMVGWLVLLSLASAAEKIERPRYRTAYACEGNQLHITCEEGHVINLIRANYGRFSITVCNQHGNTEWSVNCMSTRSFRVLQERCSQQNSCSILASTRVFGGDPCPGTLKYLEAHYQCESASTTTSSTTTRLIPPWFITTTPSDWLMPVSPTTTTSTTTSTTTTTTAASTTVSTSTTTTAAPDPSTTTASSTTEEISSTESSTTTSTSTTTTTEPSDTKDEYCAPIRVRDLQWNWTKKGEIAAVPCPGGASGYAKWRCGNNPVRWTPENPDLSGCKSAWLSDLTDRIEQGESVMNIAAELAQVTKSKPMYGGDTLVTTAVLKKMATKMASKLHSVPANNKEEVIKDLMQSVIETSSNLLDPQQRVSWNDLSRLEQMKAATSLLVGLEENAYLLADQVNYEKVLVKADRNVMMSVKVFEAQNVKEVHFPTNEDLNNVVWDQAADSISLSAEAVLEKSKDGLVKVVFFTFSNLEELLQPIREDAWLADSEMYQNASRILNTRVIAASLGKNNHVPLRQPVILTLRHLREDNVSNPICVFWNYDRNSWSDDGCKVVATNRTHTVCSCNHLTNFAVLMDVQGIKLSASHELALQMITYIGCSISIVCLALSLFTFTFFRGLKSDRTTIHKNLCFCLLVAEIVFLVGIGQTDRPILCGVVAGLLHFFFLCTFAWMFLEGFQLYVMLIEVFETEKSRVRWYYVLAYGLSAITVAVSCVIDPLSYGTERYCWLRADNYFIFSFVGPVIAVIVANIVFLSIAIYMMCKHANISAALKNKEQSKMANIRAWVRGALILVFLLGLTWAFGLLYVNEESVIMAYTFTVLNSLQGLFIFVFHCLQNEKVQKEYKKLLRRSQCLPVCMRETVKERRSSFYVNSNGTASMPNSNSSANSSQQSYFRRLWGSNHGRSGSGRSSISKPGSPPGTQSAGPLDLEVEKVSYKSSNRDSGHGGSDHEDSSTTNMSGSTRYNRAAVDYGGLASDLSGVDCSVVDSEFLSEYCQDQLKVSNDLQQQQQQQQHQPQMPQQLQHVMSTPQPQPALIPIHNSKRIHRPHRIAQPVRLSPLNHIYMDIDGREGEPVYEEIDHRHEHQVSDLSDEDSKRRSDVSRQSSGSYGDNRPLIPQVLADRERERLSHNGSLPGSHYQHHLQHNYPHHHYHPRNAMRGRPPPPPQPQSSPSLDNLHVQPQERIEHGCKTLPDKKAPHGSIGHHHPTHHSASHQCLENNIRQPKNLPEMHGDEIINGSPGGINQDLRYPSDNTLFVAMLDGRKVVCRLQPASKKDPHTYKTNSFSEC